MLRRLGAPLLALACLAPVAVACVAARTGELEPRYVAVHNTLAAMGFTQVGPLQQGSLGEGREARVRLDLKAECTTVVTLGGAGVRDVDVALLDADDKPVAHDTTQAPQAALRVCPATAGRYTLVVKMAAGAGDYVTATWAGGAAPPASALGGAPALASAGAGTCESPLPLTTGATTGNTRHGEAENVGGCASSDSKELVYKLEVTRRQRVTVEIDPQFDSVLYLRKDDCADTQAEIACNDDATAGAGKRGPSSRGSRLDEVLEPGTYFLFVDGYNNEVGTFRMNVQIADVPSLAAACRQVRPLGAAKIAGTLSGGFDHARASCGAEAKGPDALHSFDLGARARVRITEHSADFSPAVHLRTACADERTEVGCADGGIKSDEATWAGVLPAGSYVLFADSSDTDARGRYTLESELAPEAGTGARGDTCGDAMALGLNERSVEGDTFLARDDAAGKCGGQGAPDVFYRFELTRRSRVTARFKAQESEHTFVLTRSCTDRAAEIACGPIVDDVLAPGVYYLAVDGATVDTLGRYTFAFLAHDVSAQEGACRAPPVLVDGATVKGTTVGAGDRFTTSCAGQRDAQASPDRVYQLTLAARAKVRLVLSTPTWDGVLAVRTTCVDLPRASAAFANEAACNNDFQDTRHARVEATLDAGTYFVVVDGHKANNEGAFSLEYRVVRER
jgi:hypothetical protein